MPVACHFNGELEEHFIVVHWDQRGAGKSNPANFDESTMTFDQYVADAHELTLLLKSRFGQGRIYLVGHSWGSQVGIRLAQLYPEDYYAYVSVSQVVNAVRAQQIGYDWLMKQVRDENERSKLESLGQPPFTDHERFVHYIQKIDAYGGGFDVRFTQLAWIALLAPEYNLQDLSAWLRGSNRGSGSMWSSPEFRYFDAVDDIPKLETPVYFFSGQKDYNTPLQLVESYFDVLDAPHGKHLLVFDASAHTPFLGEEDRFNQEMVQVKYETYQP
jgi:pimeloyl-ACP methyl ester carboxylesterase